MIILNELSQLKLSGELFVKLTKYDKVIYEGNQKNLIVNGGFLTVANLLATNFTGNTIDTIGFGDGITAPVLSDTTLSGDYFKKIDIDTASTTVFGTNQARIYWDIDYDTDIGGQTFEGAVGGVWPDGDPFTIKEFGLFTDGDNLFNRIVWSGPNLIMDEGIRLEGYFIITTST